MGVVIVLMSGVVFIIGVVFGLVLYPAVLMWLAMRDPAWFERWADKVRELRR